MCFPLSFFFSLGMAASVECNMRAWVDDKSQGSFWHKHLLRVGSHFLGHAFAEDAIICMRVFLFELLVAHHGEVSLGRSGRLLSLN
jgi:hypothetical protein